MLLTILLSTTFACGLVIAAMHVFNRLFLAPVYDVVLNLLAFTAATVSNAMMGQVVPAVLSACAVGAWLYLALRTYRAIKRSVPLGGQSNLH